MGKSTSFSHPWRSTASSLSKSRDRFFRRSVKDNMAVTVVVVAAGGSGARGISFPCGSMDWDVAAEVAKVCVVAVCPGVVVVQSGLSLVRLVLLLVFPVMVLSLLFLGLLLLFVSDVDDGGKELVLMVSPSALSPRLHVSNEREKMRVGK